MATFAGLPYVMLQSFAHLMITALSLDCGYSASAIRERIYSGASGHGIPLVHGNARVRGQPRRSGGNGQEHLAGSPRTGARVGPVVYWNDPVCAQHDPADPHEERFLHGAALPWLSAHR